MKTQDRKNLSKLITVIVCMALYGLVGSLERGWFDWMGLIALMPLVVPLTITWIREGGRNE